MCMCVCVCFSCLGREGGLAIENVGPRLDIVLDTKHCVVRGELDSLYVDQTHVYIFKIYKYIKTEITSLSKYGIAIRILNVYLR